MKHGAGPQGSAFFVSESRAGGNLALGGKSVETAKSGVFVRRLPKNLANCRRVGD